MLKERFPPAPLPRKPPYITLKKYGIQIPNIGLNAVFFLLPQSNCSISLRSSLYRQ